MPRNSKHTHIRFSYYHFNIKMIIYVINLEMIIFIMNSYPGSSPLYTGLIYIFSLFIKLSPHLTHVWVNGFMFHTNGPQLLAPGTGFVEDKFSTDVVGDGSGGNGSGRGSIARSPAAHLLLWGPVPNRPRIGGWGPLFYTTDNCVVIDQKSITSLSRIFTYK